MHLFVVYSFKNLGAVEQCLIFLKAMPTASEARPQEILTKG
jgi:hypothetical protein